MYKKSIHSQPKSTRIFQDSDSEAHSESPSPAHVRLARECRRKIREYQQELRSKEPYHSQETDSEAELGSECETKPIWRTTAKEQKGSETIRSRKDIGDIDSRLQELQSFLRAARQGLQQTTRI